jgi:hypothetical protein
MEAKRENAEQKAGEGAGRISSFVASKLQAAGVDKSTANLWSFYAQEIYGYIERHKEVVERLKKVKDAKDVWDGSRQALASSRYLDRAKELGLQSATNGLRSYGAGGGADVLAVFVDHFEQLAKQQGIPLNDCSMQITKVALDIATAGAGSVFALSGFGLVVAGLAVIATAKDSYALGQACFVSKE